MPDSPVERRLVVHEILKNNGVYLQIAEQSHRGGQFAVTKEGIPTNKFYTEGFMLSSVNCPQACRKCDGKATSTLFVRGSNGALDSHMVKSHGIGYLKAMRHAVEQYNLHNGMNGITEVEFEQNHAEKK